MLSIAILLCALFVAGWATWPPRGEQRGWLFLALVVLWGALVLTGLSHSVLPGFTPWLLVLALLGALVALIVIWSATNFMARPREQEGEEKR